MLSPKAALAFLGAGLFLSFDMWLVFALFEFGLRFVSDSTFAAMGAVCLNAFFVMLCQYVATKLL
jgi:hypothetical protein